jgi:putative ABC transport system substrate-binding protein
VFGMKVTRAALTVVLAFGILAAPLVARAQQPAMPVIGFLSSASPGTFAHFLAAFRQGLNETGYVEGRNVAIEYRWAENQYDRLPALATELVRRQPAVTVASGGNVSALAAKAATSTIPIVFTSARDPIKGGLVASLNRPGGNMTGIGGLTAELDAKRLELLRELVPKARTLGALINPNNPDAESQSRDVQEAARALGQQMIVLYAGSEGDIDTAFGTLVRRRIGALLVGADPGFASRRAQLIALAARHSVPAIYQARDFAVAAGLASYGPSLADGYRQVGIYAGRILKGAKPADLPVVQPTKFELVINVKTATALGLTIPQSILLRADEVIQ